MLAETVEPFSDGDSDGHFELSVRAPEEQGLLYGQRYHPQT
jgi:hypothetical protein